MRNALTMPGHQNDVGMEDMPPTNIGRPSSEVSSMLSDDKARRMRAKTV